MGAQRLQASLIYLDCVRVGIMLSNMIARSHAVAENEHGSEQTDVTPHLWVGHHARLAHTASLVRIGTKYEVLLRYDSFLYDGAAPLNLHSPLSHRRHLLGVYIHRSRKSGPQIPC